MQSIAVIVLLVAFCGACMAQKDPKCVVPEEDQRIPIDCLNQTKGGELNYQLLVEDRKYLSPEERCDTIMCIVEAKKYVNSNGELDEDVICNDIDTVLEASDKTKKEIKDGLEECIKASKTSDNPICASMECFTPKCIKACV